jgi:protein-tyrosine-phosphatase
VALAPGSVLFACTLNAVRSPMAEALMKHFHGKRIYCDSVGVRTEDIDPLAVEVMGEIGLDLKRHMGKSFEELSDLSYDLVITLSPEAQHRAMELTRHMACDVEYWRTFDPSAVEGNRETRLDAYRQVRDELKRRILKRFPLSSAARD